MINLYYSVVVHPWDLENNCSKFTFYTIFMEWYNYVLFIICISLPFILFLFKFSNVFRGVVAVRMDLLQLDVNQCSDQYYVPNAFKDTHKCDKKSSYVSMCLLFSLMTAETIEFIKY